MLSSNREYQAGTLIYTSEDIINGIWKVLDGVVRVVAEDQNGHEITLFRIFPKQYLLHDFNFFANQNNSIIKVIAERYSSLEFIKYPIDFSPDMVHCLQEQIKTLISLATELAFNSVEQRLFSWLSTKCISGIQKITVTHQELANHLGTSREVISRILKDWESQGALLLARGTISLKENFKQLKV